MATRERQLSSLEQELNALLEVERFDPPAEFKRARAALRSRRLRGGGRRPRGAGGCARRPSSSTGSRSRRRALDDSNPPFYKWFADGKLNASANCLDRHVEAGNGERVAYHWRGEEGEERDVTYAELLADTQRFANALQGPAASRRATSSASTCR